MTLGPGRSPRAARRRRPGRWTSAVARHARRSSREGCSRLRLLRNVTLLVLPFLAGYFARRRGLDTRGRLLTAAPFVLLALAVDLYPYRSGSATQALVAVHGPVLLWFAVAYAYMGGTVCSHERRMDVVRFIGEWVIHCALIALGGGVLMGLTALILEPIGPDLPEQVVEWVLPSGAARAVTVAAWLVEAEQRVVENRAPVLTMLFTRCSP